MLVTLLYFFISKKAPKMSTHTSRKYIAKQCMIYERSRIIRKKVIWSQSCFCFRNIASKKLNFHDFLPLKIAFGGFFERSQCIYFQKICKWTSPVDNYLLKVNNRSTRPTYEICLKLTIKTPERRWCLYC